MGDLREVDLLLDALQDNELSSAAADALSCLMERLKKSGPDGQRDVQVALSSALAQEDPSRRAGIVGVLKRAGHTFGTEVTAALRCRFAIARAAAAEVLGCTEDVRAAAALLDALDDNDQAVVVSAANALQRVVPALCASDCATLPLLLRALNALTSPIMASTLDGRSDLSEHVAYTAQRLVRDVAKQATPNLDLLEQALEAPHARVAVEAARALHELAPPRSAVALLRACLRGNAQVSFEAGKAFHRIKGPKAVDELTGVLNLGDRVVARGACAALVAVGRPAVQGLIKVLNRPYIPARIMSAEALARIGDRSALPHLKSMARDRRPKVAAAAKYGIEIIEKR
jgi:HEAT repeat protein